MKKSIAVIVTLGSLTACSLKQNMDEMHDDTHKMGQTTQAMAKTTDGMAQTTEHMDGTTNRMANTTQEMDQTTHELFNKTSQLYADQRQGGSLTIRNQCLDYMEKSDAIESKISEAGEYFQAFEFQLWKGDGVDTQDKLQQLYLDAVEQFFRDARRYSDDSRDPSPTSDDSRQKNLYALAVTMHRVNPNAEQLGRDRNVKPASVLSLVEDTLSLKPEIESGKVRLSDLAPYQKEILNNESDAIYMLQLRSNFLAVMTLAKISELGDAGFLKKLEMLLFSWDAQLDNLNLVQIDTYTTWENEAIRERDYLASIGQGTGQDHKVMTIYRKMKLNPSESRAKSLEGLVAAIDKYRQ